jgi:hypothetical protein
MTKPLTSAEIFALRQRLLDNGWNVVPSSPRDKSCHVVGWPVIETNLFYLDKWMRTFPAHTNDAAVGNKNYIGIDIDVLSDPDLAHRIQVLAFEHLGETPFIRVGRRPKRLLVYRKRPDVIEALDRGLVRVRTSSITSIAFKAANGRRRR